MSMILRWDKPEKIMSVEQWKRISFDGGPPGAFIPNMSPADAAAWKARCVVERGKPQRVEIRKTTRGTQMLVVVTADSVTISANGRAHLSAADWDDMTAAVAEARAVLAGREEGRKRGGS